MNEYHDGILLFDLTEEKIWNYAAKDSAGLYEFHQRNKDKYMWGKRVDAVIYNCNSKETATKVMKSVKKGMDNEKKGSPEPDTVACNNKPPVQTITHGLTGWTAQSRRSENHLVGS